MRGTLLTKSLVATVSCTACALTVLPAVPANAEVSLTIDTLATPQSGAVGSSFSDVAAVFGNTDTEGTITFRLYDNPTGTGTPLFTDPISLMGLTPDLVFQTTSAGYTATAVGTDYWVVTYTGASNASVTSGLSAEPVVISSATPVPEPPSLALLATGLVGLGLLGWRRKRKAQAAA